MALVPLESLAPGLRLNEPVFNGNGVLLLKEGQVLTGKHLQIFKTWGVLEVDVVREDGGEPEVGPGPAAHRETVEALRAEMAHRFRRVHLAYDPVMAEILRVGMRRLALQRAAGEATDPGRPPGGAP